MSYSPIQFQRGLSMAEFQRRFGTETLCAEALFTARWPKGFECPECGGQEHCLLPARGLYQCNVCHHQTSLKAGTIFHASHLPLRKWFLAMHLLTQGKHGISALELMRQIGVSYETAWNVKHKLMQVMMERERGRVLSGRIELDDAYMGGERHGGKRGRGASGKAPFLVAAQTSPERKVVYVKLTRVRNFKSRTMKAWAKESLARSAHVITDGLNGFLSLGAVVDHHERKVMPGGWRNAKHPAFVWVNTLLGNLKGNLLGVCRGIGLKHLPRYLSEFQWRFNHRFDLASILQRLLRAAVLTPPMSHNLLVLAERNR